MTEGEWVRTKDLAVKMFQVIFKCQFVCMCCQSSFGLQWLECCVCVWENVCVRVCVFCYLDPLLLLSVRSNKTKTLFFLSVYTHIVQLQFNIRLTARAHTHTHTHTHTRTHTHLQYTWHPLIVCVGVGYHTPILVRTKVISHIGTFLKSMYYALLKNTFFDRWRTDLSLNKGYTDI